MGHRSNKPHLEFVQLTDVVGRKTHEWGVQSTHDGLTLGKVYWRNTWRKYVLHTWDDEDWDQVCLDQASEFLKRVNAEHKAKKE